MARTTDRTIASGSLVDEFSPPRHAAQELRNTLRLNAVTSTLGGVVAVATAGPMSNWFGTGHAVWYRSVGLGLLGFAVVVAAVAGSRVSRLLRWTPVITGTDALWVIASIATVSLGWYSTSGVVCVIAVAAVVGGVGLRQAVSGLRTRALIGSRLVAIDEAPPVEVVHVERVVSGDLAVAWQVVTDHELYGRLAPNLTGVRVDGGEGPDLTRTCTNRKGEQWGETCTLWEPGHRYEVAVETTDYPYPLTEMRGAWFVEDAGRERVRVGMDFRFRPREGIWGRSFAAAMHVAFPPVLDRIIRGWRREIEARSAAVSSVPGQTESSRRPRTSDGSRER